MSGSADKEVKFWEWAIVQQEGSQARQLTVRPTRTLKMTDDVLCVRISPNGAPFPCLVLSLGYLVDTSGVSTVCAVVQKQYARTQNLSWRGTAYAALGAV